MGGTVTAATPGQFQLIHTGSGVLSNGYGVLVPTLTNSGGGTISAFSGVYVEDQSATAVYGLNLNISSGSGKWNVYSAGTATSYFASDITVGSTSAISNTRLSVRHSNTTASSTSVYGISTSTCNSATSYQSVGVYGDHTMAGNSNNSNSAAGVGIYAISRCTNTATVSGLCGVMAICTNTSTGTVNAMFTNRAMAASNSGGGTVGTVYGFYADDQTVGTNNYGFFSNISSGTNKWSFYSGGTATSYFSGTVLIGTTSTTTAKLNTITSATGATTQASLFQATLTSDADSSAVFSTGVLATAIINQSGFNNTTSTGVRGIFATARASGSSGSVTSVNASLSQVFNTGGGTIVNGYAFHALNPTNSGGGTITNAFGIYIDNISTSTTSTAVGSNMTSGANKLGLGFTGTVAHYLEGSIGIGVSTASAKLHVLATTEQARFAYDSSNYMSITVASNGATTFDAIGAGAGFTFSDDVTIGDSKNFIFSTGTGTKFGTGTTQKLAFHNATPVVQRSGAAQAAVVTTAATQTTPWGFSTQAQADAIVTLVNELRAALTDKGLIKGSA